MKIIKKMRTGEDFNLLDGWTNKETIIRIIPFFYLFPVISDTKKIITWLYFQIILPHS